MLRDGYDTEADQVAGYLFERFEQLGFTREQGRVLAAVGADWQRAERLLSGGCDHETAFDILS